MNWRSRRFAVLEFSLRADTPTKLFADDRAHYTTFGHDDPRCPDIREKRTVTNTSLSDYVMAHEGFDGEIVFADPWPCSKCIPTESLPKYTPPKDVVRKVPTEPDAKSNLRPYRTGGIGPAEAATDGQVRKMMALYRKAKPNATKEQIKAAEARAMAMTKKDAIATINRMEKGEKPAEAHATITKGATVTKGGVTGKVFWTGTGKSGAPRYGVVYTGADGTERKEFAESGWSLVTA